MRTALVAALVFLSPAAAAAPIWMATAPSGDTVTLHDDPCPWHQGARFAVWQAADKRSAVPGCWVQVDDVVLVAYVDGDRGKIGRGSFRKVIDS